ncbi:hypothetical protein AB0I84_49150 [Streptomyces spectabilis]|uniref:hypothetical protein n=1 Tax=Streptomyces spectabilis TaxID=68270 RepID=UPI0033C9ABA4
MVPCRRLTLVRPDQPRARSGAYALDADPGFRRPGFTESAESTMVKSLTERPWDVVVGGGIRKTEPLLPLFEQIVNLIRRHAPQAAIAFNSDGGDTVEAARRWL